MIFTRFYLHLADCQHKSILRHRSTLERGFTATHEEYTRCKKCRMVWQQPLQQSVDEWHNGLLRDDFTVPREPPETFANG